MTSRPKAADVARAAGVSTTTVSFVLNGRDRGNVSATTAQRVKDAADSLGYTPDGLARSLRLQRTHVIGLVTDAIASSPFAGRLLGGAVDRATEDGFVLVLFDSQDRPEREQAAVDELGRRRVDGLLYATMGRRELHELPRTTLPMVLANCTDSASGRVAVVPDDEAGGAEVAAHLASLGHRRLTMLSVPTDGADGDVVARDRERGFRAGAVAAGLAPSEVAVVEAGWSIEDGYAGAMRVLAEADGTPRPAHQRPSALFAITDRAATGVLLAAGQLGLRIPQDLSVAGFDDQEYLAGHVVPALTTAALPHRAMGEFAADALLQMLAAPDTAPRPGVRRLSCPLVVRESTGPVTV